MDFLAIVNHDRMVELHQQIMADLGYGYEESRLTEPELIALLATADGVKLYRNYERGILTGGELDYRVRFGGMPWWTDD